MDRWIICEMLKGNKKYLTKENIQAIESMSVEELKEGTIEFLIMKMKG